MTSKIGFVKVLMNSIFNLANLYFIVSHTRLLYLIDDFLENRKIDQRKSFARYNRVLKKIKTHMSTLSNKIHTCDPEQHVKGNLKYTNKKI